MTLAFDLGWIIAIVLVAVGIYAMLAPHPLAHGYGVPAEGHSAVAFVRATGIRDVAFGVALGATAYYRLLPLLIVLAVVGIAVSTFDLWVVFHHVHLRRPHTAHAIHASGIVAFILILAMALFAVGR